MNSAPTLNRAISQFQAGNAADAFSICEQLIANAPRQPEFWQLSGLAAFALERYDDAARRFQMAAGLDPANAAHPINLANALIKLDRDGDAARAFVAALSLDSRSAEAEIGLGIVARRAGRLDDAVAHADRAIDFAPRSYRALVNRGRALHELGRLDEAIESYDRAIAIDPQAAPAHGAKALSLLLAGSFEAGWIEYEWRGEGSDLAGRARFAEPEWNGEPLPGGVLLVHAEQGFGDTIQFARFLPVVASRGVRVIAEVQPALAWLLRDSFPSIEIVARGDPLPRFDRQIRLLSLPRVLGVRSGAIPTFPSYLVSAGSSPSVSLTGDPRLTVGISWAGNPAHENDRNRSLAPSGLDPLGAIEGIRWISLQKGDRAAAQGRPNFPTVDLGARLRDFADLAQALRQIDLLISVDSAPAHLMGALGRPVWILLPEPPDWRWQQRREDSPWYPSARLFRQQTRGDWSDVVARLSDALTRFRDTR